MNIYTVVNSCMSKWLTAGELVYCIEQNAWDDLQNRPLYQIWIQGPQGTVTAEQLWWVTGRRDFVEWAYTQITLCLQGEYHCCLSDISAWA